MALAKPVQRKKSSAPTREIALVHRLHALLHTVRLIGHAEDELCTLLHEAEHGESSAPAFARELAALIARLPAQGYLEELEALQAGLPASRKPVKRVASKAKSSRTKTPIARKVAGRKAAVKKPTVKRRTTS